MGDLDGFGKFSIKTINSKNLSLEATAGGSGAKSKIVITSDKNLAADYNLLFPAAVPPAKGTLQTTDGAVETFLWEDKSTEFENESDLSADGPENNYKIRVVNNATVYYGIESGWDRINNWFTTATLGAFAAATDTHNITHETTADEFFIGSTLPNLGAGGWYRIESEDFSAPSAAVNIDSNAVPGHGASDVFDNQSIVTSHDSFTSSVSDANMGVILLHQYSAATLPYVEWEYVGSNSRNRITAVFGFISKLAPTESGSGASTSNWGSGYAITCTNGVFASIGLPTNGLCSWGANGSSAGSEALATPTDAWDLKCCHRIQFMVDSNTGEAEIVYVTHNNRMAISKKSGLTINNVSAKGYYLSTQSFESWRLAREPVSSGYLGTLVPKTYILNCAT